MDDSLLVYDEPLLTATLSLLPGSAIVAFAVTCARRLAAASEAKGIRVSLALSATELLHSFTAGGELGDAAALEASLLAAMPDGHDEKSNFVSFIAEDALAATVYALRCAENGDAADAVLAARMAYEAADRIVGQGLMADAFTDEVEITIRRHPTVQAELRRQRRDLYELQKTTDSARCIASLIRRAAHEPVFN